MGRIWVCGQEGPSWCIPDQSTIPMNSEPTLSEVDACKDLAPQGQARQFLYSAKVMRDANLP